MLARYEKGDVPTSPREKVCPQPQKRETRTLLISLAAVNYNGGGGVGCVLHDIGGAIDSRADFPVDFQVV